MGFLLGGAMSGVADGLQASKDKKQAAINQERELNVHALQSQGAAIQSKLGQLAPDDPNRAVLTQQLSKINSDTTDLFHPSKDPGALQHLGALISQHVLGHPAPDKTPPVTPGQTIPSQNVDTNLNLPQGHTAPVQGPPPGQQTPAALKEIAAQRMADYQAAAAVPASGALPAAQQQEAERIKQGIDPRAVADKAVRPSLKFYKNADTGQTGWYNANNPDSIPEGYEAVSPGTAAHPSQAAQATYIRMHTKDGTPEEYDRLLTDYQKITHPETLGAHEQIAYDANGDAHIVHLQSSSQKVYPSTGKASGPQQNPAAAPGGPSTPGALKTKARAQQAKAATTGGGQGQTSGAGGNGSGRVSNTLPMVHKNTADQTKAKEDVTVATKMDSQAKQLAANPNNPVAQKQLALALIKGAAGRVNMQEFDILVKNNGLGNTLEGWATNAESGALPPEVVNRLIDASHRNLKASQDAAKEAYGSGSDGTKPTKVYQGHTYEQQEDGSWRRQ